MSSEWVEVKVKDLVKSNKPVTYGIVQPGPDVRPNGVPLIRGKDYSSGKVVLKDLYHVKPEIDKPYTRSKVVENDILFSIAGYVGQIAIVPNGLDGANITQTTARISPEETKYDSKFTFYALHYDRVKSQVIKYAKGSAQEGLNLSDVEKIKILLPVEKSSQRKIARILSTIDGQIEKTEAILAKYQAVKQGMLQDLFTRGIDVNTGQIRPRYEDAPDLYQSSALGMIPKEWTVKALSIYISFLKSGLSRKIVPEDIGIPVLTSGNIDDEFKARYLELKYWYIKDPQGANTNNYILDDKDILLCFINSLEKIGKLCLFRSSDITRPVIYTTNLFRIKSAVSCTPEFLYFLLSTTIVQNEIAKICKIAVNQASFTTKEFLHINTPCIGSSEQDMIVNKLITYNNVIQSEQDSLSKLQLLKQGLMQDLLSGKVEVTA